MGMKFNINEIVGFAKKHVKNAYSKALQQLHRVMERLINLWKKPNFRLGVYLFATLLVGLWIGKTFLIDSSEISQSKTDKEVEVDKSGAISVTLPGVTLDPNVFHFDEAKSEDVPVQISVPGKLVFNSEKTKVVTARAAGRVEKLFAFDGAVVKSGQILSEFYSPDFISAQQEMVIASKMANTIDKVAMPSLAEDAQATLEAAITRLKILGGSEQDINVLRKTGKPTPTFPMRSPIDGIVIKRMVDPGAFMNVGDILATVADPKALWFMGNVYEQDIKKIATGQALKLKSESYPDREFIAHANYVSPTIDPVTHALMIRCDVQNDDGALRPEMYVSAKLEVGSTPAIVIPRTAVIQVRNLRFAIIRVDNDTYRRVPIKGFDMGESSFAVTTGLEPGAQVMTIGATLMNQRFLKQED